MKRVGTKHQSTCFGQTPSHTQALKGEVSISKSTHCYAKHWETCSQGQSKQAGGFRTHLSLSKQASKKKNLRKIHSLKWKMGRLKEVHALSLPEKPLQGYSPCRKHTGRVLEVQRGQTAFGTGQVTPVTAMLTIIIISWATFSSYEEEVGKRSCLQTKGESIKQYQSACSFLGRWQEGRALYLQDDYKFNHCIPDLLSAFLQAKSSQSHSSCWHLLGACLKYFQRYTWPSTATLLYGDTGATLFARIGWFAELLFCSLFIAK